MTLPKSLTTVTTFSKILAGVLFIILPFLGFYLGMEYQKRIIQDYTESTASIVQTTTKPTTDPTANWKTYTNENFSYTIKYPDKWVTIPPIIKGSKTEEVGLHGAVLQGEIIYLDSDYRQNPTQPFVQIETLTNQTQEAFNAKKQTRSNEQETIFAGYTATISKKKIQPEPGTNITKDGYRYSWFIFNSKLNNTYEIICYEDFSNQNLCTQILSTFKFL